MKSGTRLLVAASLLATGLALPVIASGDKGEQGSPDECVGCSDGCDCQSARSDHGRAGAAGVIVRRLRSAPPAPRREVSGPGKGRGDRENPSPRARAEKLGLWLHDWAEGHPMLARMGSKLLLEREFHPKAFLKALDDLPGPARRELIRAMDRLAQYEQLLAKHPDDYRDFVHEHFPERFDHMMRLWDSAGHEDEGHREGNVEPRSNREERGARGVGNDPRHLPEPPEPQRPGRRPALEENDEMRPGLLDGSEPDEGDEPESWLDDEEDEDGGDTSDPEDDDARETHDGAM